jgi:hypothetical protein
MSLAILKVTNTLAYFTKAYITKMLKTFVRKVDLIELKYLLVNAKNLAYYKKYFIIFASKVVAYLSNLAKLEVTNTPAYCTK